MKVRELIGLLEECDENAEVLIVSQPSWPFEYSVAGIAQRSDDGADDDGENAGDARRDVARDGRANDVFIVEGTQLRYGSKSVWDNVIRE